MVLVTDSTDSMPRIGVRNCPIGVFLGSRKRLQANLQEMHSEKVARSSLTGAKAVRVVQIYPWLVVSEKRPRNSQVTLQVEAWFARGLERYNK
jgi:hypothetical protein